MSDDNNKDFSDIDLDKLIEEYTNTTKISKSSNSNNATRKSSASGQKKFVVHIDESLVDNNETKTDNLNTASSSSGGIYFSNYQRKRTTPNSFTNQTKYRQETTSDYNAPKHNTSERAQVSRKSSKSKKGKKINEIAANKIERIGGKAAVAFLAFILISTIVFSYIGITCVGDMLAINRSEEVVSVTIPENASYSDIIGILQDNGLIKRKLFCKLFTKYRKYDDESYLSGVYYLNSKMGIEGMLKDIMVAPVTADTVKLSFPEGWTIQQMFEKLEKYDVCSSSKLYTAVKTSTFGYDFTGKIADNIDRYLKLEGYMFPDTYDFYVNADTNYIVRKFLDNFDSKWTDEYTARAEKLGYSIDEIMTVASIIQKEAADSSQMKTIASILYNRLSDPANYPTLGCDSTAIYISNYVTPVVGEAMGSTYYNKYDTSAVRGLPPGPICNPGIDAIKAALYPADTNYYFFAHDNSGKIYVAQTYKEHKNNLVLIIKANNKE